MNSALFIVKALLDKGVGIKSYKNYRAFNSVFLMRAGPVCTSLSTADATNNSKLFI